MCDGYSDCGDDYEDDEEFPEPPAPKPVECPFGCGSALAVRRLGDQELVRDSGELKEMRFRRWAELPCGHEGDKWITTMPMGKIAPGVSSTEPVNSWVPPGVLALAQRTPTERQVVDLTTWTDPTRAPAPRKKTSRLTRWVKRLLRR